MKKFLSLALALTMALTLAACGGKTDTPPADTNDGSTAGQTGGKLVVYSALNEDNTIAIADQFKKDTGIEIEYISLGGGDAVARVQAEMANPKADILVGGSVDLYGSLADAGAFEAYDSPNNDSLDARFNDPNHFWQGWYMGVLSIIINEERPRPSGRSGRQWRCKRRRPWWGWPTRTRPYSWDPADRPRFPAS